MSFLALMHIDVRPDPAMEVQLGMVQITSLRAARWGRDPRQEWSVNARSAHTQRARVRIEHGDLRRDVAPVDCSRSDGDDGITARLFAPGGTVRVVGGRHDGSHRDERHRVAEDLGQIQGQSLAKRIRVHVPAGNRRNA